MKIIYTIFIALTLCFSIVEAQIVRIDTIKPTNTNYHNLKKSAPKSQSEFLYTAGLRVFSYEQYPKILNQVDDNLNRASAFNGLMFKFNDNQLSYRLTGSYLDKDIEFFNECMECEKTTGNLTDLNLAVGFEKNITYSMLRPYFGADLGYRKNKFSGSSKNAGTVAYTVPYDVVAEKTGGVFSPFFGLKYNVLGHLTVGLEAAIDFTYSYERQEKMYQNPAFTRTFEKYQKFEVLSKPISWLSVQYNFGLIN